ncbi:glycosyltransferase family 2 protein, partial [candidate division KSB1 bacterium]|nr:glycosyltransferase family 2 protein [candidate division KSB1 bacterium]
MNKNPQVSVVMPVFNGDDFLLVALESVAFQDYPNLEIIVINDGSTDKSGEVLTSFLDSKPAGTKILEHPDRRRHGIAASYQLGLQHCQGKYIAFLEHDDFWSGGSPFESEVELHTSMAFKGERSLTVLVRDGFFRFKPESYASYELLQPDGSLSPFAVPDALVHMKALAVFPRFKITNEFQLNGRMFYREIPIFSEAAR